MLSQYSSIVFRDCPPADWVQRDRDSEDDAEERELLLSHPSTNVEIKECLSDLKVLTLSSSSLSDWNKVLNAKDFKGLLKWRVTLREFAQGDEEKETNEEEQVPAIELTEEQQQNLLQQELDDKVKQVRKYGGNRSQTLDGPIKKEEISETEETTIKIPNENGLGNEYGQRRV